MLAAQQSLLSQAEEYLQQADADYLKLFGGVEDESCDQNLSTEHVDETLKLAIISLAQKLPVMEQELSEISEMRKKFEKKELELNETIAATKEALSIVNQGFQSSLDRSSDAYGEGEKKVDQKKMKIEILKGEEENQSSIAAAKVMDSEETVADHTIQQLKDSYTLNQIVLEKAIFENKSDHDRLLREMAQIETDLQGVQSLIDDRRELYDKWEIEGIALEESKSKLETELEDIAFKYCEMNAALLGQSFEQSQAILQSVRVDSSEPQSSPVLQTFVRVFNNFKEKVEEAKGLALRIAELQLDEHNGQLRELTEKLESSRIIFFESVTQEEKMQNQWRTCGLMKDQLDTTLRDDLVAAMRWAKSESCGIYQPSIMTAPLVSVIFRQYCREQGSPLPVPKEVLMKFATPERLRRFGWTARGFKLREYSIAEVQEAKFDVSELRSAGYLSQEIEQLGYFSPSNNGTPGFTFGSTFVPLSGPLRFGSSATFQFNPSQPPVSRFGGSSLAKHKKKKHPQWN
jgi:hypothetical protein